MSTCTIIELYHIVPLNKGYNGWNLKGLKDKAEMPVQKITTNTFEQKIIIRRKTA